MLPSVSAARQGSRKQLMQSNARSADSIRFILILLFFEPPLPDKVTGEGDYFSFLNPRITIMMAQIRKPAMETVPRFRLATAVGLPASRSENQI